METMKKTDITRADNYMEICFSAKSENEGLARMLVASFLADFNPSMEEMGDVKIAVSEAVTNAVIHGYEGNAENGEEIHMICARKEDDLYLVIEDAGKGMEDIRQAMEPLYTTRPDLERSGMGFSFMEAFMDRLEVESEPGKGTKVLMQKRIQGAKQQN